jgi:multidrug/hemolysin transport system permease protein
MTAFAKRNILVYFRDIRAMLYSLLGVFIVMGLYALFLRDNLADSFSALPDAKLAVNCWLIAGLCAVTPVTTALGGFGILITDRDTGIERDFLASPVRRLKLVGGYLMASLAVAVLLSFVMQILGGVWLWASGAALPSLQTVFAIISVQLVAVLAGGSMVFFLVTFFSTNNAFIAISTITGTLLGFLTGMYLPLGALPNAIQWVVKIFPITHAASLLRWLFLQGVGAGSFSGIPQIYIDEVYEFLGVRLVYNGYLFPLWGSALVLLGTALLFFALSVFNYSRKR